MRIISFKGMELYISILATINFIGLGLFQYQHMKIISFYWVLQLQFGQIFLFIGMIIFGFILGTKIYNCIKILSSLQIFLFSDITFLLVSTGYSIYIYEQLKSLKNTEDEDEQFEIPNYIDMFSLFCQVMIGISISVNYIHTISYLKINSNEFSFLFIPLFLSTGILINEIELMYYNDYYSPYQTYEKTLLQVFINYTIANYFSQITPILIRLFGSIYLAKWEKAGQKENKNKVHVIDNIDKDIKLTVLKSYFTQYYQIIFLILLTTFSGSLIVQSYFDILYYNLDQYNKNDYYHRSCNSCFYFDLIIITFVNFLIAIINLLFQRQKKIKIHLCISIGILCVGLAMASYSQSCVSQFLIQWGHKLGLGTFIYKIIPMTLPQNTMISCFAIQFITQFVEICLLSVIYNLRLSNSPQICSNIQIICQIYLFLNLIGLSFLIFYWKEPKVKQQNEEIQIMLNETKNNNQLEE